jgi:hypothetical protein
MAGLLHSVCSAEKFSLRRSQRATVSSLLTINNLLQNALETKKKNYSVGIDTPKVLNVWLAEKTRPGPFLV